MLRQFLSVILFKKLQTNKTRAGKLSLVRGKHLSLLASSWGSARRARVLFTGIFSLIDVILARDFGSHRRLP
jgi:c-di-GMP-related signal transduction protein